jgi:hypothetical protein
MDSVLGSILEEGLLWATWPLPCPLDICVTSAVFKVLWGLGELGELGR